MTIIRDYMLLFQLTASQGGWLEWVAWYVDAGVFQLTASQGGWHHVHRILCIHSDISTHSLTRRLTTSEASKPRRFAFQLTASQGGWRTVVPCVFRTDDISTHSLTRRLTDISSMISKVHHNFNSQPHKEADDSFLWVTFIFDVFQLTASQGGWRDLVWPKSVVMAISTHSLTRRLTVFHVKHCRYGRFQLTASQGGWRDNCEIRDCYESFQLTASQGGWLRLLNCNLLPLAFQLTASQGGWHETRVEWVAGDVFQLTASQGGWRHLHRIFHTRGKISTHSLTRRLTAISDKNIFIQNWFFYLLYILVLFFIQIIIF